MGLPAPGRDERGGIAHLRGYNGPMGLIDTHCHLDVPAFDPDRDAVLARARAVGVTGILVPAIQADGWGGLLALCAREPDLYPALGLHPVLLDEHRDQHLVELERRIAAIPPIAVGEIGLDYQIPHLDPQRQQRLFEAQLAIARSAGLPVLLHVRKAHDQVLATLRRIRVPGGIIHAFNGSLEQGRQYLDLGFLLGFGGMLTYPRSTRLQGLARALPLEGLVLETDAPDMTVATHRGERNSPEYLPECLQALAAVRGIAPDRVAASTNAAARRLLGLSRSGPRARGG